VTVRDRKGRSLEIRVTLKKHALYGYSKTKQQQQQQRQQKKNNKSIVRLHYSIYTYTYFRHKINLRSTQKITEQEMHSAINRETAKHLGEALSIAPFLRIEKKRRICTLHASDWIYRAAGTSNVN